MSVLSTCVRELLSGKKIIFFGTGQFSNTEIEILSNKISYFCDNNPVRIGSSFYGRPVVGVDTLRGEEMDGIAVVINTEFYEEVAKQLLDMGIQNLYSKLFFNGNDKIGPDNIGETDNFLVRKYKAQSKYDLNDCAKLFADANSRELFLQITDKYRRGCFDFSDLVCCEPIYFNSCFQDSLTDREVYADCGVYNGQTILDFIFYVNGRYHQIYAFEPDYANHLAISRNFSDFPKLQLFNSAVANVNGVVSFDNRGTQSSRILDSDTGGEEVAAVRMDDVCKVWPTFIKMDIEGAEYDALLGARNIIEQSKPKLAVSIYHREDDLCRLPLLIKEMRPDYKFYLLHHTPLYVDTVLYAL